MSNNLIIILTPQHLCDKPHRFIIYWLEVNLSTHLWERGLILWGVWFPNISIWIVWIDDCCSWAKCLHMIHDSYIEVCTSLVLRSSSWIDRSLRSFFHRRFMVFPILFIPFTTFTGPIARVTGCVSYLKQELKIFPEHLSSSRFLMGSLFLICFLCLLTLAIVLFLSGYIYFLPWFTVIVIISWHLLPFLLQRDDELKTSNIMKVP